MPLISCVTSGGTVWDVLLLSKNRGASRAGRVLREHLVQTLHFVDERVSPARRTRLQVGHLVGDPGSSGRPDSKEETAQECAMGCLPLQTTGSHSTWRASEDPCVEGCPCSSWGGSGGRGKALGDNAKSYVWYAPGVSPGAQTEPLLEAGGQRGAVIQGTSRPEKV